MFKYVALATTLASSMAIAAPAKHPAPKAATAKPLPVFDFLGDNTETPTTRTMLNSSACHTDGDEQHCSDFDSPKIADQTLEYLTLDYHKGKLYMIIGAMDDAEYTYILRAFTTKYGAPAVDKRKWESKGGAVFDNMVAIWHFRGGGKLELESMGQKVGQSSFSFQSDANSPPAKAAKVDF